MSRLTRILAFLACATWTVIPSFADAQDSTRAEHEAMYLRYQEFGASLRPGWFRPHWMADGRSFWYAEGGPANTVIYRVDPVANAKAPLFDSVRLRAALRPVLDSEPPYHGLPFEEFQFLEGERAVTFTVGGRGFVLQLATYAIAPAPVRSEEVKSRLDRRPREVISPDRHWFAGVKDHNIYLRSIDDGHLIQLTTDGVEGYGWDYDDYFEVEAQWSPDSRKLAVMKMDSRQVNDVPFVHWLKPKPDVEWQSWRWNGPVETNELYVIDVRTRTQVRINTGDDSGKPLLIVGWHPNGSTLFLFRRDRSAKTFELMAADPLTGAARTLITETRQTFVRGFGLGSDRNRGVFRLLPDGKRFLWASERDGWNHFYLYDIDGTLIRQLTSGTAQEWGPLAVDDKNGWLYYYTAGITKNRPYDGQLRRIDLQGGTYRPLTATGQHFITFSPSNEFFTDWSSASDRPGTADLRSSDGRLIRTLATQNVDGLKDLRWHPPEEFVVKAADGRTDIYGVLYTPYDFDPSRKYPVIDFIYGAPCCLAVPWTFEGQFFGSTWASISAQGMAQLGFITFIVDGRGTPGRGKEFQDMAYGNVGHNEIPDHVATLRQLAFTRSYMDMSRVGITGYSSGGDLALRAMLTAPDVYHVGVAGGAPSGADVPGMGEWFGPGQNPNSSLAGNLKGKLLLIHGTNDHNVLFADAMKMTAALIRAGKYFDLIVLPEESHGSVNRSGYVATAIRRYFQEHLQPEQLSARP